MDGNTCSSAKASLIPVGFPALQGQRPGPTVSRFQPHECPQSFIPSTGALVGPSSSCCVPQLARATGAEGGIPLSLLPLLTLPQASHSLPLSVSISVSLCFSVSACLHLSVSVSLCLCISLCLSLFVCLSCCLCVFPLLLPWTCQAQPRVLGITVVSLGNLFDWIERGAWSRGWCHSRDTTGHSSCPGAGPGSAVNQDPRSGGSQAAHFHTESAVHSTAGPSVLAPSAQEACCCPQLTEDSAACPWASRMRCPDPHQPPRRSTQGRGSSVCSLLHPSPVLDCWTMVAA